MEPKASHQPRAPSPRTRTGHRRCDRVSLAIAPLNVCFLLPLRATEGGREGGPHLPLSLLSSDSYEMLASSP